MEYFPGQRPDEDILTITRPHWLTLLSAIVVTGILALVPIGFFAATPAAGFEISGLGSAIATAVASGYYLALVTYFFIRWIDFYLDVAIVTSDRIVDIDQHGLFRRTVDELDCKMIQDVSATKHGILQTLFNFGTVEIQTAGERRNFTFVGVPNPSRVQELVAKAQGMGEADQQESTAEKHAEAAAKQAKEAAGAAAEATKAEAAA
ncbi:MAG: PH domain-containing protein, partial [Patescibacteria group bacterium]